MPTNGPKKKGKAAGSAQNPEKVRETLTVEEEAMASVFKNEPDPEIRKRQGSRTEDPRSKVDDKIG